MASAKCLGSGMKCDNVETDYTKAGNPIFNSFTIPLKTSCKNLPILFDESSAPFHFCFCLIRSRIFNLAYLTLSYGYIWLMSRMLSRAFVLIDLSSES